ncbi:DUF5054 domain-containing protein [Cohnella sp. JJ-181]|uniref:DUF5054 domain-containing protein n=1 Tax=Cohnella rhizoplanae TaxID=2974897 RepID=UPI0022FF7C52|nr:DUF5054 domain-containing protein [Cohnella sp. JJ-181]CAI6040521.1 hypothetical protein COHCIP112018_01067 [Cohnella sp. JJ-181]
MTPIERVHVIFKTHLDIGFTHLAERVIRQYMDDYIPKAIELAERLAAEGGAERFVWTTGSWLIRRYLDEAGPAEKARMERAIAAGHIAWHGLPFTTHTELMDAGLFEAGLAIGRELDARFGKETVAAKMTDVPGHTIGMVPLMARAGLRYLHLGVNPASKRPDVPRLFRWQAEDGSEIIVNYAGNYGEAVEVEGLGDVLLFAHTGDNCGPPDAEEIRLQFRDIERRYPGAQVLASTMDAFALRLESVKGGLPVLREEIGDTWIHGAGTDPLKLARLRALQRLRGEWVAQGRLREDEAAGRDLSEALLLTAEHTWGLDVKKWLPDFRHYAKGDFTEARRRDEVDPHDQPAKFGYIGAFAMDEFDRHSAGLFEGEQSVRSYAMIERSWAEQRAYAERAVAALPAALRGEAQAALAELEPRRTDTAGFAERRSHELYSSGGFELAFAEDGSIAHLADRAGKQWVADGGGIGAFVYETFGTDSYGHYFRTYMQNLPVTHPWADVDFGKPGIEFVRPLPSHKTYRPALVDIKHAADAEGETYVVRLRMPEASWRLYGAPRELELAYVLDAGAEGEIGLTLQWFGKDANRLPEASWLGCSLNVGNPNRWTMDKLGSAVSPLQVVQGGNRNLHAVGTGVSYRGADGEADIATLDAALAAPGQRRLLRFDGTFAPLEGGWHFNLHNNIWGTNFPMWYGEDGKFRYRLKLRSNRI